MAVVAASLGLGLVVGPVLGCVEARLIPEHARQADADSSFSRASRASRAPASAPSSSALSAVPGVPSNAPSAGESVETFERALRVLGRAPTGRQLLARAQAYFNLRDSPQLVQILRWGNASRTDAVLTRQYDSVTGRESRTRQVTIYLRRGGSVEDLVFDLAHELVHATTGPTWDPYDPQLTAAKYVWISIEGDGGEVDAVVSECRVAHELNLTQGTSARRCKGYLSQDKNSIERAKVAVDFYRVGRWAGDVAGRVGRHALPLLSSERPRLFSSTGRAPYPVSLIQEFDEITRIACDNSRRRLAQGAEASSNGSRQPASADRGAGAEAREAARSFVDQRCAD